MGGMRVKLIGLSVEKLYGSYNYEVSFNHDVTFIYGTNGCGKTTILNITEAIITGHLFKLFKYSFKRIELEYSKKNSRDVQKIVIVQNKKCLDVTYNGSTFQVNEIDLPDVRRIPDRERDEAIKRYFHKYPKLNEIKEVFNYVYLPLNRTHSSFIPVDSAYYQYVQYNEYFRYQDSGFFDDGARKTNSIQDRAITEVEELIYRQCSRINVNLNKISDAFRNSIVQSALSVQTETKTQDFIDFIIKNQNFKKELSETQSAYLSILDGLNLTSINKNSGTINKLFDDALQQYEAIQAGDTEKVDIFNFYHKYCEIAKIKSIVKFAEETEERKSKVRKPIEVFLDTMNSFIRNTDEGKEIRLDPMGQVYFVTKFSKQKISVHNLSSGEKQLLIFFANLIFGVKSDSSGIFVVDEPELSLHLDWQRIFVEKTMEVTPNIQLIFATHAPEIIGRHRDKMFKLEKEYAK